MAASWFLHARLLVNLCFDLVFFFCFSLAFSFFFLFVIYLWPQNILKPRCAVPSVKNANITEIYVIIQSACGIFCYCIFLLLLVLFLSVFFFFCVSFCIKSVCLCCARLAYFIDVSQVLDGFLIVSESISKLFATLRTLIKLTSGSRIVGSNQREIFDGGNGK